MKKIYVDTNVILDFAKSREDSLRPLDAFAFEFFSRGWNCEFALVTSSWVEEEALRHTSKLKLDELLSYFREKNKENA
jgi:hypothetical protein